MFSTTTGFEDNTADRARHIHLCILKILLANTQSTTTLLSTVHPAQYKSATPTTSTRNLVCMPTRSTPLVLSVTPTVNLFEGLNHLGIPTLYDPNDGTSAGAALVPTDLDPKNQTRSDARRTYYDPYAHRPNMHVITGQHVTRLLIEGVNGSNVVADPTAGGNQNGDGTANGNPDGFGFGPSANTPPLGGQTSSRFVRRQDPSSSSLRVTGVQVRICPLLGFCARTRLSEAVCTKCVGTTSNGICYEGSYCGRRFAAFCAIAAAIWNRSIVSSGSIQYTRSSESSRRWKQPPGSLSCWHILPL